MKTIRWALIVTGLAACQRDINAVDGKPVASGGASSVPVTAVTVGGVTSTTGATGSSNFSVPTALALMASEFPAFEMPCGTQACSPPPDMLFVAIASAGNTCFYPHGGTNAGGNDWQTIIGLPAKYQVTGTYPLSDPAITDEFSWHETTPSGASVSTVAGGFSGGGQGTIEVVSVDKTQITVRLNGTNVQIGEDGEYSAKRCTPLP